METKVVNLPFDEAAGSLVAHDYSPSALHATVINGIFSNGRDGNCLFFPDFGYASIESQPLNFNDDFTIMFWVQSYFINNTSCWAHFEMDDPSKSFDIEVAAGFFSWTHLAFTRKGNVYSAFINGMPGYFGPPVTKTGNPIGFTFFTDNGMLGTGYCALDDFQLINGKALTNIEVELEIDKLSKPVLYLLNGISFSELGIMVSKLSGIVGMLPKKIPREYNWTDQHGKFVDLTRVRYDMRNIEMECWMTAPNRAEMMDKIFQVRNSFEVAGTQRLMLEIGVKPLIYEVALVEGINFDLVKWRDSKAFCSFTLKMVEYQPVKKVLRHIKIDTSTETVSVTISCKDALTIYWGDGTKTTNVFTGGPTAALSFSHTYSEPGTYYIVISGVVENITSLITNAIEVWSRLS